MAIAGGRRRVVHSHFGNDERCRPDAKRCADQKGEEDPLPTGKCTPIKKRKKIRDRPKRAIARHARCQWRGQQGSPLPTTAALSHESTAHSSESSVRSLQKPRLLWYRSIKINGEGATGAYEVSHDVNDMLYTERHLLRKKRFSGAEHGLEETKAM
ncbi:hypothetical protein ACLOJK_031953 [Asimina triloba]